MKGEKTQAEKKLILQFKRLVKTDEFLEFVAVLREKIGIPKNGVEIADTDKENLGIGIPLPEAIRRIAEKNGVNILKEVNLGLAPMLNKLAVKNSYFKALFRNYIYFGDFFFEETADQMGLFPEMSLCSLVHAGEEYAEFISDPEDFDSIMWPIYLKQRQNLTEIYPIAIYIHPDATIRDIKDFIQKNSSRIKHFQKDQRLNFGSSVKNSKTRINERIARRNQFIYDHRNLPRKEINKLLPKNGFELIDDGLIGKIISLEKKKREKK